MTGSNYGKVYNIPIIWKYDLNIYLKKKSKKFNIQNVY